MDMIQTAKYPDPKMRALQRKNNLGCMLEDMKSGDLCELDMLNRFAEIDESVLAIKLKQVIMIASKKLIEEEITNLELEIKEA